MASNPLELEKARHELELLKQRERELEKRLGLDDETTETETHKNILFIDLHKNNSSPHDERNEPITNGDLISRDDIEPIGNRNSLSPFYEENQTNNNLTSTPISLIIEESVDNATDITSNESVTLNLEEDIEYDTDQYDGDSLSDDSQVQFEIDADIHFCNDCLEKIQNSSLQNLNGDLSSDGNDNIRRIDLREKIREDIEENRKREIELQFERGSIENLVDYIKDTESDSDISEAVTHEDVREKILREIEAEKMRDLEIQARYKQEGFEIDENHDAFQKTELENKSRDPKLMLEKELEELAMREKELHLDDPNYGNDSFDENSIHEDIDTRGKIKRELEEQKEREEEMEKLRRTLSSLNLASTEVIENTEEIATNTVESNDDEESSVSEKIDIIDTRQKILQEIEEQKKREEEIKKQSGTEIQFEEKNVYSDNEIDYVECQKIDMRKLIENEMNENINREKEIKLKKENIKEEEIPIIYNPQSSLLASQPQHEDEVDFPINKKFGSRDDLLAHIGSTENIEKPAKFEISIDEKIKEKRSFQAAVSKIQIPKIFIQETKHSKFKNDFFKKKSPRQQTKQSVEEQVIVPKDISDDKIAPEFLEHTEMKDHVTTEIEETKTNPNKVKRKRRPADKNLKHRDKTSANKDNHLEVKANKRVSTNPFSPRQKQNNNPFADDVNDGKKRNGLVVNGNATISKESLKDFSMLADDEATNLSKAKALFANSRNPFKIAMLAEHWEKKSQEQKNEIIKTKNHTRKQNDESANQIKETTQQKTKRESLEFLWKSKKSIVTEEENPDKNDIELLTYMKEIRREYKQQNGGVPTNQQEQQQQQQQQQQRKDPSHIREKPPPLQTAVTLEKTIRKWEKRIAKHSTNNTNTKTVSGSTDKVFFV